MAYLASPSAASVNGQVFIVYGKMVSVIAGPGVDRRFDRRLATVAMTGDEAIDTAAIIDAGRGGVDVVLDILPPAASAAQVRPALMAIRPNGRVVLMGGITDDLDIPYAWIMRNNVTILGQWLYPRTAPALMVSMVHAGQVRLDEFTITEFDLNDANDAIDHAAANAGPFTTTVLRPNRDKDPTNSTRLDRHDRSVR